MLRLFPIQQMPRILTWKLPGNVYRVRSFFPNELSAHPIYYYKNGELPGFAGMMDNEKKLFFMSLPLSKLDGGSANVNALLNKVFIQDFGLTP